jgi:glucokinase-like ROK family protein
MNDSTYPRGSSQFINKLNKIKILNLIRESGTISRAEAAKKSGISAPTVTRIVDTLINEDGLVREIGEGASSGGRPPKLLEFSGLDNFVIGLDLGTTHIYGVLANLNAEIISEVKRDTKVEEGFERVAEKTADIICELQEHFKVRGKKIFGIGMAVAGLINREKGVVEYSPDFHWINVDIAGALARRCKLPIIFDNVTRVMALGELWYGLGREIKNFIVINIGYGIGAGIIIDGKPLYGPKGMAGEFGHITLDKDSDIQCECGNYGCLEALASGRAIAYSAKAGIESGENTSLVDLCQGDLSNLTAEMVADAARQGDPFSNRIFNTAADYLGIGIAGLVNLFSPDAVIIGGGVSQAGDLLFDIVKDTISRRAIDALVKNVRIEKTVFGVRAAVMGSVALILHEVLQLHFNS